MPRFNPVSATGTYKTLKQVNAGAVRTKGNPEVLNAMVVFAFDTYAASTDHLLVYGCQQVLVEAQAANADIASVNFLLGQRIYWDAAASKVTNVLTANTLIGRVLEAKDYSGGVALGNQLLIELRNDA